ncbi:MAG: flagella biosynthesis chaperone FliJ [Pseudomonadaceae bacterium]|nr:MAG: flagella biosynthesis chaperone FliJ [Pseudomonadaceae bacterium]
MSESRVRRLQPVLDMALEEERKAAGMLGKCQQQYDDAHARLHDLNYYAEEYQRGWAERGAQGVNRQWLVNYQQFLGQMQSAVVQQEQTLQWHQSSVEKARLNWQQRYQRVEALRKLIDRYREEARVRADKQEQKMLDELSQRAHSVTRREH